MKRRLKKDDTTPDQSISPQSEPHSETVSPTSAGQLWRERLVKNQLAAGQTSSAAARSGVPGANMRNRFQNTAAGDTDRKSRKGRRPG